MNYLPALNMGWSTSTPVILQTEATECGLACLAMVATHFGDKRDLNSLRRQFSPSLKGATLKHLMDIAKHLELASRPLKLEMEHLTQLKLPCILHWDMSHFVVLVEVKKNSVIIHDPAIGKHELSLQASSTHFTGIALELTPTSAFTHQEETRPLRFSQLFGKVSGLKRSLFQAFFLTLLLQLCAIALPFQMQWVVDEVLVAQDKDLLMVLGLGFGLLIIVQVVIGALRGWVLMAMSASLGYQWAARVFSHLLSLPVSWFEKRHLGDVVSRFQSIDTIQRTLTNSFVEAAIDGVLVIGTLIMMLLYSAKLAAITIIAVSIYALMRFTLFRPMRAASQEEMIHTAKAQSSFMESVRGIQSVKLFNRVEERRVVWLNQLVNQFNSHLSQQKMLIVFQNGQTLLFGLERSIVIWLGALAVMNSSLSVGMLFAYLSYKDQFSSRMAALIDKFLEFRLLKLHGERLADIVLAEPEEAKAVLGQSPADLNISLNGTGFRYSPLDPSVLDHFDLQIKAGECIAITGGSGCGKTTLAKIILGILEPTAGDIKLGGLTPRQIGLNQYRSLFGTVMQDDSLFAGSIEDNITFFDPQPDQNRMLQCALMAAIHDDILTMPMAYNTLVGDMGTSLSGGQKQRVLLARALYKQPKILVLDEATSHLDVSCEQHVNTAIKQLKITRIIIAHRPETIAMADRVVVMERGKLVFDQKKVCEPA
ncbi:peptidase domain-containing ABC transporter [Iodobacter arcticus]|uniref:Peptidase domain-containing ABC transporter n=1 Tax=Iodobacter arcticus TaxID=590593 RepID=A0ABW2R002_9NEIS